MSRFLNTWSFKITRIDLIEQFFSSLWVGRLYGVMFLALQASVMFVASANSFVDPAAPAFMALFALLLLVASYFFAPIVYRSLLFLHLLLLFGPQLLASSGLYVPAIFRTDAANWGDIAVYVIGVIVAVEFVGVFVHRQRRLLADQAEAEQRVAASETLLRSILETSPNLIVVKNREKRYEYVNAAFLAATGWREADVIGRHDRDLMAPALAQYHEELGDRVLSEGRPVEGKLDAYTDARGATRWFTLSKLPIWGANGEVERILSISSDVTELKITQDALNRNVRSVGALAEVSAMMLAAPGFDAGMEAALPVIGETLEAEQLCLFMREGLAEGEASAAGRGQSLAMVSLRHHWVASTGSTNIGSTCTATHTSLHEEGDRQILIRNYHALVEDHFDRLAAGEVIALDGTPADKGPRCTFIAPIFVESQLWGALGFEFRRSSEDDRHLETFFSVLATNIGVAISRHEAQRANTRERNLLRTLIDHAPDFVYIKDVERRYIVANRAFVEVMGFQTEEEVIGKTDRDIHPPHVAETIRRMDEPVIRGLRPAYTEQEEVILPLTNTRRWMLTTKAPFHNAEGEIVGLITISRDVTEMKEVENRLREAKEAAEAATRAKSEFLANMSHEIRTPMNGVIGMTSLLLGSPLRAEQREFVETIRTSSDDLLMILNDILDYSKIESGKMELENVLFDPLVAVEDVVELYSGRRYEGDFSLGIVASGDLSGALIGDATRFRQIVGNLVANAVKFTEEGEVLVRVGGKPVEDGRYALDVSVRDTGIGIPAARLDRLFQSFSQVDSSTTRRYGGTGLGLAISKRLVDLMDGEICVHSEEGKGSEFAFRVLLEQGAGAHQTGAESGAGEDPHRVAIAFAPRRLRPTARTFAGYRFVIADPNPYRQYTLSEQLRAWGGSVEIVDNLTEMPARLTATSQAVLLCDSGLYDGAVAALQSRNGAGPIPIVRVGGRRREDVDEQIAELSELAAAQVVARPVKPTALAYAIASVMQALQTSPASAGQQTNEPRLADQVPLRILLVEDNAVNQRVAMRMLDRLGYHADLASNGVEAVAALRVTDYDVIFMDIHMPEMDGHTATQVIRAELPAERQPYIIAMTADAMPGYREQCLAIGMDDYIAKPVRLEDVAEALRLSQTRRRPAR